MVAGREHVVVGAGVAGLYAALLLARRGRRVRVVERAARPGGLAGCEWFRGLPCDLGSHRLHPSVLDKPLFRELHDAEPLLQRPRRGVLLLGGRRVPYPPAALSMLRALGMRASFALGLGLLARGRQRRALLGWERERTLPEADVGFERFVVERVGEAAYQAFYKPYVEKVWGVPPCELSQTMAKKRVSTAEPWKLLRRADGFLYPRGGLVSIVGFLEQRLAELGVEVRCGEAWDPRGAGDATVLFSGDLAGLVETRLEHRGLHLVYLALPIQRAGEAETYYVPEPQAWFGRVSELQGYSPLLRCPGETVLCVEIPEGAWGREVDFTAEPRMTALLDQLVEAGVVPKGVRPTAARRRFVPQVYPVYRRGWQVEWTRTMERVARLGDVFPFGRQGLFLHSNLDHSTDIAAELLEHLEGGHGVEAWIERARRFLELRVRD